MNALSQTSRSMKVLYAILAVAVILLGMNALGVFKQEPGKAKRKTVGPLASVINADVPSQVLAPAAPPAGGFSAQTRLGFFNGDQWEPAIASDRFGHVYMLYPQYYGVPGCDVCGNPTQILQISNDHGTTWGSPIPLYTAGANTGQSVKTRRKPGERLLPDKPAVSPSGFDQLYGLVCLTKPTQDMFVPPVATL